jgi:hypothetical protein
VGEIVIHPVHGCAYQCVECGMGNLPTGMEFMGLGDLDGALAEMRERDLVETGGGKPLSVYFSGGGNPVEHPDLSRMFSVVRSHFPQAHISVLWNLGGASERELRARTQGLGKLGGGALVLSFDTHHYRGLMNELFPNRKRENAALSPSKRRAAAARRRQAVFDAMCDRVRWALFAARTHRFKVAFSFVGSPGEIARMKALAYSVHPSVRSWGASEYPRLKRGAFLGMALNYPPALAVLHDGTISDEHPRS